MKYCIIVMLLIELQSCRIDNTDGSEIKVFNDTFGDLIEEIGALDLLEIPPLPMLFFDNNDAMGYDTVVYNKTVAEIEKENRRMKDTTLVIAVFDTLFTCYNLDLNIEKNKKQLPELSYIDALNALKDSSIVSQPLNLSELESKKNIKLKYYSEFPKGFKIWKRENYDFLFSGVLRMSRIYFDKKKQVGLFYCSYACGRLCGEEAIICIRKISNRWSIEKTILLSVS